VNGREGTDVGERKKKRKEKKKRDVVGQAHSDPPIYSYLKLTLKQLRHVSVQSPSSRSILFELSKVTVIKIIN
jgi:hypothetical protein